MQALMAQINPHFIYNSLESINSMAVLAGNRDISKMVISLGRLLRISISQNQEPDPAADGVRACPPLLGYPEVPVRGQILL